MIQQHYYTRERKGIFSRTPGYDTVAKSKGLYEGFITSTLQGMCFYEAPASLAGEEDTLKYPRALFCVNTEDDKMIIGQSVFAGKDYTGQRNRYFTHNYIISEDERDKYIANPDRIIYSSGFAREYDIEKGMVISEVSEIARSKNDDCFNSIEELFLATGMNIELFTNLIKACFDSAQYGKKIYIVLDSESNKVTELAKGMLKYLYRGLPFAVRRKIGFITYMKEPRMKDLINIVFLCKGSIKRLTTEIKAGYVFDLASKNFYLDGMDEEKDIFTHFVMDNIENGETLNDFFYKADKSCIEDKLSISEYEGLLQPIEEKKTNVKVTEETKKEFEDKESVNYDPVEVSSIWKKIINFIEKLIFKKI
jgi:hypothetical protein